MNCPACQSDNFEEFDTEGVTVDFCGDCHSIWMDSGELAFYTETASDFPSLKHFMKAAHPSQRKCPKCADVSLLEVSYIEGEDVKLDVCGACMGILLDKKEIVHVESLVQKYKLTKLTAVVSELSKRGYVFLKS